MTSHDLLKAARKAGTARTEQDQTFQTVGHPLTTDHNIHDDFVRNPPKNVAEDDVSHSKPKWAVSNKSVVQSGVLGEQELGRIKQADAQSELVEESSVHS